MKPLSVALAALIVAPIATLPVVLPVSSADAATSWGHASAPDQTIRSGCRDYRFHYDVTAPGDEWMAELTLVNPHGRQVSTRTYESAAEKRTGTGTFELCEPTTSPGRYRIKMKVTSYDDRASSARQVAPGTFRLTSKR